MNIRLVPMFLASLGIAACGSPTPSPPPPSVAVAAPAAPRAVPATEQGVAAVAAPVAPSHAGSTGCTPVQLAALGEALEVDLDPEAVDQDVRVLALACKAWPARPDLAIASLIHGSATDDDAKDWVTTVSDRASGRVLSMHRDRIEVDASVRIHANSLEIDTAAYRLAPGVIAFGIRKHASYSPQCADGGFDTALTLFVHDGTSLRVVLAEPFLESWSIDFSAGHHPCGPQEADYRVAHARTVLAMRNSASHGYRDIEFATTVTTTHEKGDERIATFAPHESRVVVRWDGSRYALPDWFAHLDNVLDDALALATADGKR